MRTVTTMTMFCILWLNTIAQAPQAFKYQAVTRNSSGEILPNRKVSFRITIQQRIVNGIVVYAELHSGMSNNFGLVNLEIGKGTPVYGIFSSIKWGADEFYLRVEMDPDGGTAYQDMGITQLLSVPYALHAGDVENEADGSVTNEIQDMSLDGNTLKLSDSPAVVDLSPYLDNTDSQKLGISGLTLSISGGNSIMLPAGGAADNWGSQVVQTDATLSGEGTTTIPLKIARQSANNGQVLKWDGTTWKPATDETGSGSTTPTGPAGGDLSGTYPDPVIGTGKVTSAKILDGAITSAKITQGAVTGDKITQAGATTGQVLKWSGTSWLPGIDLTGSSLWTESGSNIYRSSGKVGIGTINPQVQLDVRSSTSTGGIYAECVNGWSLHANSFLSNGVSIAALTDGGTAVKAEASGLGAKLCSTPDKAAGYFTGNVFIMSGKVGIGTTNPQVQLDVRSSTSTGGIYTECVNGWSLHANSFGSNGVSIAALTDGGTAVKAEASGLGAKLCSTPDNAAGYFTGNVYMMSGKVGIGTSAPAYKFHAFGDRIQLTEQATGDWIALRTDGGTNDYLDLSYGGGSLVIQSESDNENIIMNPSKNKVGIHTWTPQYDLDVSGNIRATGSVYYGGNAGTANGLLYNKPDYVFRESYDKMTTSQVEEFLKYENHLPWVTSAEQEKKENGEVTDMTRMAFETLESVENLQLQLIGQHKLILELKSENDILRERLEKLEKLITASALR